MREYSLRLFDDDRQERFDLALHPAGEEQPLSYLLEAPKVRIFAGGRYYAQIVSPRTNDIRYMEAQINHYPVESVFHANSGHLYFDSRSLPKNVFADTFGLARITLRFRDEDGMHHLHSDYMQVVVASSDEYFSVNAMGEYIAQFNQLLFYGTRADYIGRYTRKGAGLYSLEDKIRVLKRTAAMLEGSWRLIRQNPRRGTIESRSSAPGSMAETVRYLMNHPEALRPSNGTNGIRIGSKTYIPDLSKAPKTTSTTDVYENQVTLSFLKSVCEDIQSMIPELEQLISELPLKTATSDGLVSSASFMMSATRRSLHHTVNDLQELLSEYKHLYEVYCSAIPASEIPFSHEPKATPAFLRLPGYHHVYDGIHRWFAVKDVSVRDVRFVRTFLQITEMYEVYVLAKLSAFFTDWGFELTSSRKVVYEFESYSLYRNTEINNLFTYEKDDLKITLFYQPVLYDQSSEQTRVTGLVRSTSLSMPIKGSGEPAHGTYYTPDYVFRIESDRWKGARYILADAKYASSRNVRDFKMFPLLFKYLFSLTPLNSQDQITGLYVFNGKSENPNDRLDLVHSVYDLVDDPHRVFPQAEIISFYEYAGQRQKDQFDVLRALFEIQFEKARETYEQVPLHTKEVEQAALPDVFRLIPALVSMPVSVTQEN